MTIFMETRVLTQMKVTDWVSTLNKPEWEGSRIAAYRIWLRVSQFGWEQCHEWRYRDELNKPDWKEMWINSINHPNGFPPNYHDPSEDFTEDYYLYF